MVCIGHNFQRGGPVRGWRKQAIRLIYRYLSKILLRVGLQLKVDYKYIKYDYSKYLGSDYLKKQKFPKHISTYVSNHVSWTDIIVFISVNQPAFASKVELQKIPVFGLLCEALGCIFISRGAGQDEKNAVIDQIKDRQKIIEEEGIYPPIIVFPEGGTSNGSSVLSFKKGAFAALKPVRPVFLKYESPTLSIAYDVIPFLALYVLQCCSYNFKVTFHELPPFIPNEYLFENHKDKGADKWEIYAETIREIMTDVGKVPMCNMPYREKTRYEIMLGYKKERKQDNKQD